MLHLAHVSIIGDHTFALGQLCVAGAVAGAEASLTAHDSTSGFSEYHSPLIRIQCHYTGWILAGVVAFTRVSWSFATQGHDAGQDASAIGSFARTTFGIVSVRRLLAGREVLPAAIHSHPAGAAHALAVHAEASVVAVAGAFADGRHARGTGSSSCAFALLGHWIASSLGAASWHATTIGNGTCISREAEVAVALAAVASAVPGAGRVRAHQLQRAVVTIPAFLADASAWVVASAMAAAAARDGAVHAQEAREAEAGAFNAITVVRALVGAEHLASLAAVAHIALTLAVTVTTSLLVAVIRTYFRRNRSKSQTFVIWANRRWCFYHRQWHHFHAYRQASWLNVRTVVAIVSCLAVALAFQAISHAGAIIWTSRFTTSFSKESLTT
jgi:hypothetical protein